MCGDIIVDNPVNMGNIKTSKGNMISDGIVNKKSMTITTNLLATSVASKTPRFRALNLLRAAKRLFCVI